MPLSDYKVADYMNSAVYPSNFELAATISSLRGELTAERIAKHKHSLNLTNEERRRKQAETYLSTSQRLFVAEINAHDTTKRELRDANARIKTLEEGQRQLGDYVAKQFIPELPASERAKIAPGDSFVGLVTEYLDRYLNVLDVTHDYDAERAAKQPAGQHDPAVIAAFNTFNNVTLVPNRITPAKGPFDFNIADELKKQSTIVSGTISPAQMTAANILSPKIATGFIEPTHRLWGGPLNKAPDPKQPAPEKQPQPTYGIDTCVVRMFLDEKGVLNVEDVQILRTE